MLVASPIAALPVAAGLLAFEGSVAWARSETRAVTTRVGEIRSRRSDVPDFDDTAALRRILLDRHPDWGSDRIERILEDHPEPYPRPRGRSASAARASLRGRGRGRRLGIGRG